MSGIRPVLNLIALAWWRWARQELQQCNPMHPDLPMVVLRVAALEAAG